MQPSLALLMAAQLLPLTLFTFGDSILDCARYNPHRVAPARLLLHNDDALFPSFRGRDLASKGIQARLVERARDGATAADLEAQLQGLELSPGQPAIALVTVGGNDLLQGLIADPGGEGIERLAARVEAFLQRLPIHPVLLGTVYDPSGGHDSRNFLPVDPALGRRNHLRYNTLLAEMAPRYGALVDIHAHFMAGDESWFAGIIEPSLEGASEVRAAFWPHVLQAAAAALGLPPQVAEDNAERGDSGGGGGAVS